MTPEEYKRAERLGELYDRLIADIPKRDAHQALVDILAEYGYDDVVFMLNVIKEDLEQ